MLSEDPQSTNQYLVADSLIEDDDGSADEASKSMEAIKIEECEDDEVGSAAESSIWNPNTILIGPLKEEEGSLLALCLKNVTGTVDRLFELASQIRSPIAKRARTDVDVYGDVDLDIKSTYKGLRESAYRDGIEQLIL